MIFHVSFEDACVAGFFVWLVVSLLWNVGSWLKELAWTGLVTAYHHLYFRIWAWKTRPRRVRRK